MMMIYAMSKRLATLFLILSISLSISMADNDDDSIGCPCYDDVVGFWSTDHIVQWQRVGDFFIAVAYFSIPIELLYFLTCSKDLWFKWIIFEFTAFIVLCGMTHLLNGWIHGPHTFHLMLTLTVFKILTAVVSMLTAVSLVTLFPLFLQVKIREFFLKQKTWDLDREVGIIKRQKETSLNVRMLTQEIRKSLDRHTILYTTLVELSKTLGLQNCAVWMPNEDKTEMNLTHELRGRNFSDMPSIPTNDHDVREIKRNDGVKILDPDSALAVASSGGPGGPVAAIRMPMLRASNFKGGTPEMVPACYAILILVLPEDQYQCRSWSNQELEIVEVVAVQVTVALSHASVLEESQLMREKLAEQNRDLQKAKQDALMASQARDRFQTVMSHGLRRPMHSVLGLLSVLQGEKLSGEQNLVVNTMIKSCNVLSTLITDVMETSVRFPLQMRPFQLHSMIKEAACLSKCVCAYQGYGFVIDVDTSLPNHVIGDERRLFQVILHMVGNLLYGSKGGGGCITLRLYSTSASNGWNEQRWVHMRRNSSGGSFYIRLEVGINHTTGSEVQPVIPYGGQRYYSEVEEHVSFNACRKIVQLMQGDICVITNPEGGSDHSMVLVMRFQILPSLTTVHGESSSSSDQVNFSNSVLSGLKILLVEADDVNRAITQKLLDKLECVVNAVSSGHESLDTVGGPPKSPYQIVLLDLHLPDLDGFEVTRRIIRKFRSCRSCPLIVGLSASDDCDTRDRCMRIGMSGVIQKPGSVHDIAEEIKRVVLQGNRMMS